MFLTLLYLSVVKWKSSLKSYFGKGTENGQLPGLLASAYQNHRDFFVSVQTKPTLPAKHYIPTASRASSDFVFHTGILPSHGDV